MYLFKCAGISVHEHFLKMKKMTIPPETTCHFPSVLLLFFYFLLTQALQKCSITWEKLKKNFDLWHKCHNATNKYDSKESDHTAKRLVLLGRI